MHTIAASEARIPPEIFNRVAYGHERVKIRRRGGRAVWLVCEEDVKRIGEREGEGEGKDALGG